MNAQARHLLAAASFLFTALAVTACGTEAPTRDAQARVKADESAHSGDHDMGSMTHSSDDSESWAEVVADRREACIDSSTFSGGMYRCTVDDETVSVHPFDSEPTSAQREAAREFAARTEAHAKENFSDIADARAAGYTLDELQTYLDSVEGTPKEAQFREQISNGVTFHVQNTELVNDAVAADPEKPDVLMYVSDGERYELVGAMFLAPLGSHGPQLGGPITLWHHHDRPGDIAEVCSDGTAVDRLSEPSADGVCADGRTPSATQEMLHVHFGREDLYETYAGNMDSPAADKLPGHAGHDG